MLLTWICIVILISLMFIPLFQIRIYMVPATICILYIFFNDYPSFVRKMHRRKLTYEDLEDFRDADPELRNRFQVVFTRVQQIGGSVCGGILVLYAFHVIHSDQNIFQTAGILGGLLSLYARIFGYIGSFCITCLYKMKKKQQKSFCQANGNTQTLTGTNPNIKKPQETKNCN
jgi:hypothetical protein